MPIVDTIPGYQGDPQIAAHRAALAALAVGSCEMARFTAPIAAELISIVADVSLANGAQIIAGQPDYPRKLQVRITDADSSVTAGTATIVGVDVNGAAASEVVSLTGGTATKKTAKAYATVTSITVAALVGAAGIDHISVGVAADLGLPAAQGGATIAVYKANVNNANEVIGVVDAAANTIAPTSAPDATRNYTFWYTIAR